MKLPEGCLFKDAPDLALSLNNARSASVFVWGMTLVPGCLAAEEPNGREALSLPLKFCRCIASACGLLYTTVDKKNQQRHGFFQKLNVWNFPTQTMTVGSRC